MSVYVEKIHISLGKMSNQDILQVMLSSSAKDWTGMNFFLCYVQFEISSKSYYLPFGTDLLLSENHHCIWDLHVIK